MFKPGRKSRVAIGLVSLMVLLVAFIGIGSQKRCDAQGGKDYEYIGLFTDVMGIVKRSYVEEVDTKKLIHGAINGMLTALDPHSSFMSPETFKEMKVETKGAFGGLGIEISMKDGLLTVIAPIEDTPAQRAGVKAGDQILRIDDKFTKDLTITEAVKRMRGLKGSKVVLTIMRDGFERPKEFSLIRDIIQVKSVKHRLLDGGYGYLRIAQFQERTDEDMSKALNSMVEENKGRQLAGLVLDLRNDPGGLLDQAVRVSDHFVESGKLIVYTEGREKEARMQFAASGRSKEPNYPIVVLINSGSASASEIVAGALQDHKRAIVMGTQSFGKGSVQTIIPLADEAGLRLTTARYYTPSGRSIQAKGITPDIVVEQMEMPKEKPRHESMLIREKDLENHFENTAEDKHLKPENAKEPARDQEVAKPETPATSKAADPLKEDYQLVRAIDLLKGWEILKKIDQE
jgi:carboxyl-terminal processing protease